jgi:hypothetical protein
MLGAFPQEAVADGDYTTREAVVGAAERGVDYYGSWHEMREERMGHGIDPAYHPGAFQYDERRDQMVCPEGRRLELRHTQQRSGGLQVLVYGADREDCRRCPKRRLCTPQNAMPKHGRKLDESSAARRTEGRHLSAIRKRHPRLKRVYFTASCSRFARQDALHRRRVPQNG